MNQLLFTLFLGFLLGIKHAFEADHVVAVSTIVAKEKNPWQASLIGAFWGLGHTTSLFLFGLVMLTFKISLPASLALLFELLVGCMLILLGLRVLFRQEIFHIHKHTHNGKEHVHQHVHTSFDRSHFHHKKPYAVGMIHGLAGSGGLMLLVLGSVNSFFQGLSYILIFGIGSTLSMTIMSFLLGVPFMLSAKKIPFLHRYLAIIAGVLSVLLGGVLIFQISTKLMPFGI